MKRISSLLLIVFLLSISVYSQKEQDYLESIDGKKNTEEQKKKKPESQHKFIFGGFFSFQFGSVTNIVVSPIVGYRVFPRLTVGVGFKYEYLKDKYYNFDTHVYGVQLYSRFYIIKELSDILPGGVRLGLFAHVEWEALSLEREWFDVTCPTCPGRFWLNSFLVGGGIRQPIGGRAGVYFVVLWNLNETINTIYSNPIFRVGFTF
ncbi:MAG: hypothetical protein QNK30_05110 [Bacteroidales bacterium]|nr:hypothetical protein [Bacteroidales bacterium]